MRVFYLAVLLYSYTYECHIVESSTARQPSQKPRVKEHSVQLQDETGVAKTLADQVPVMPHNMQECSRMATSAFALILSTRIVNTRCVLKCPE